MWASVAKGNGSLPADRPNDALVEREPFDLARSNNAQLLLSLSLFNRINWDHIVQRGVDPTSIKHDFDHNSI